MKPRETAHLTIRREKNTISYPRVNGKKEKASIKTKRRRREKNSHFLHNPHRRPSRFKSTPFSTKKERGKERKNGIANNKREKGIRKVEQYLYQTSKQNKARVKTTSKTSRRPMKERPIHAKLGWEGEWY